MTDSSQNEPIAAIVAWEMGHRKATGHFDDSIAAFEFPGGMEVAGIPHVTLWIPAAKTETRVKIRNGRAVSYQTGNAIDDPTIRSARDALIETMSVHALAPAILLDLTTYAAAVIAHNYNFTDDELESLLSGTAWHQPIIHHVLGGADAVDRFAAQLVPSQEETATSTFSDARREVGLSARIKRAISIIARGE